VDWPGACTTVIPCFNEAATIGSLVRRVRVYLPRVLVVDDGSTDATGSAAEAAGAQVVRHDSNQGKGAALLLGWRQARSHGSTWALCLDGDGQHDPHEIPAFLVRAAQAKVDLVIGNRFYNGSPPMTPLRRIVNGWMSRRLSRQAGQTLPDTQCGYRLLRLEWLSRVGLAARRFEIESELLLAVLQAGGRVEFVPVTSLPASSPSKIRPFLDAWRWIRWWQTVRARPAHPRPSLGHGR
jgi:glycosyltransferase involved in cell wall biosynthesis